MLYQAQKAGKLTVIGLYAKVRHPQYIGFVLISAIIFDIIVLGAFLIVKAQTDIMVIYAGAIGMAFIFIGEYLFLRPHRFS